MRRPSLRLVLVTLVAGAAGALVQWYASGSLAEFSPSRIITLPVAILLGPWHGIAATLIAATTGTVRPLLLGLRLIEAAVIGAAARRGQSPLLIGTLLIVILALALGFAPELYDLPSAGANNWARAVQLLLNRMVPLVVACLMRFTPSSWSRFCRS